MKHLFSVLKLLFIVGLVAWIVFKFDLDAARQTLASANIFWGLASLTLSLAAGFFLAMRWKVIIRGFWPDLSLSAFKLLYFNLLAIFYTLFIPTAIAGETVRVLKLGKEVNKNYAQSTIVVALDRIVGAVIWLIAFLILPSPFHNNKFWIVFIIIIALIYISRKKFTILGHRVFDFSRHHPLDIIKGVTFSLIGQAFAVFANYAAFRCFDISITPLQTTAIVAMGAIASSIPISWMGISLREGSYIGLLPLYGASSTQAALAVTFVVFSNYVAGLIGGIIELARAGWSFKKLRMFSQKETDISL